MIRSINKELVLTFLIFIILLIFWIVGFKVTCLSSIIILTYIAIILRNDYKVRIYQKVCFAQCYFNKDSFFYRFFHRKFLTFLISFFKSLFLGVSLAIFTLHLSILDTIEIGLNIATSIVFYHYFLRFHILKDPLSHLFSIQFASFLSAFLITIIFVFIKIEFTTPPNYIENSLLITIQHASYEISSYCETLNYIAKLFQEIDAIKWWFMLKGSINFDEFYIKLLIWILFFFGNILALIGINRVFLTLLDFIKGKFDK